MTTEQFLFIYTLYIVGYLAILGVYVVESRFYKRIFCIVSVLAITFSSLLNTHLTRSHNILKERCSKYENYIKQKNEEKK